MKPFRVVLAGLALAGATVAAAVSVGGPASAAAPNRQFTLFDTTQTHQAGKYWTAPWSSPANWISPVNYAEGRAYLRMEVVSKPSSIEMWPQVCMWRNNYTQETCARRVPIRDEGVYWADLGSIRNWWKKGSSYPLNVKPDIVRILLKDPVSKLLFNNAKCGSVCYPRGDLNQHVPVTIKATMIFVAKGSTLNPPASWTGCPASWSSECPRPR